MQNLDKRSESRSNVFLAASLDSDGGAVAVRIRNISCRGALVEASSLPPVGSRVRLRRGQLIVAGQLAWSGGGLAGIEFAGEINVGSWVKRTGSNGQQRVDGVIAALRGSRPVPSELQHAEDKQSLAAISAALDEVCERLANTPGMSIELGENLVKLDSVAQALRQFVTGRPF